MQENFTPPYNDYASWLKKKYGQKVYKIPIGLDLTCPNRDGNCGTGGCSFCGEIGAGYEKNINSIRQQIISSKENIAKKHNANLFIPYFLNYSNTYMPLDEFYSCLDAAAGAGSGIVAIYIATRPDCIATEYLDVMEKIKKKYNIDICVELGLQSVNYHTLAKINRGHSLAEFVDAVLQIKAYGFSICAHLILNLPEDTDSDAIEAAKLISALKIDQVKLHSLFIVKGTPLAKAYESGEFNIISYEEYINRAIMFLEYLSPNIVVQRIIGRAQQENTLFSNWGKPFFVIRDEIMKKMQDIGSFQGKNYNYLGGRAVRQFITT